MGAQKVTTAEVRTITAKAKTMLAVRDMLMRWSLAADVPHLAH
jgi:hypothetical protein